MQQIKTSKIFTLLLVIAVALVLIIGGVIAFSGDGEGDNSSVTTQTEKPESEETGDKQSSEKTEDERYIKYTATSEGSALDQLLALNETVVTSESEYGKSVDEINGLLGGIDGHYWSFYIDKEMAPVGADAFNPEGGELIEWKYQAL